MITKMPSCELHGYYDEYNDMVGVGCPKCAQLDDQIMFGEHWHNETHCPICNKEYPIKDESNGERYWERFTIYHETGDPENWERESERYSCCKKCFEEKFKPFFTSVKKEPILFSSDLKTKKG